LIISYSTS